MRIKIIFLIVVTAISLKSYSQPEIDSLLFLLNSTSGSHKVDVLNRLSEKLRLSNFRASGDYARRANSLSYNLDYLKGSAYAAWNLGYIAYLNGDFNNAIQEGIRASELADQLNDLSLKKNVFELLAIVYEENGVYEQSLNYYKLFFEINKNENNYIGMGLALLGVARINEKTLAYNLAVKNNLNALYIFSNQGNTIGKTKSSLAIAKNYFSLEMQDSGYFYLTRAEDYVSDLNSEEMLLELYVCKNEVYSQNYPDSSLYYLSKSIDLADRLNRLYLKRDLLLLTSEMYTKRGEHQMAYDYHQRYRALTDSLIRFRDEVDPDKLKLSLNNAIYDEQETIYESQHELLKKEAFQNRLIVYSFGGIIIFITALLIWTLYRYRSQKSSVQKMNILNKEISNLSSEIKRKEAIIHNLKGGKRDGISPVRSVKPEEKGRDEDTESAEEERISKEQPIEESYKLFISNHWDRLQEVIRELNLNISGFSIQDIKSGPFENINLSQFTTSLLKLYGKQIGERIALHHDINPVINLRGHKGSILLLINNILQNAIESIDEEGHIYIDYFADDNKISYRIIDTGAGIEKGNNQRIFEPYFTTKNPDHHVGLGLSISQEIIKKHEAVLLIKSKPGIATEVTLEFYY